MSTRLFAMLAATSWALTSAAEPIRVGGKPFTEGYLVTELTALALESAGLSVERKHGLGATDLIFEALETGAIDAYPEYSGTVARVVLARPDLQTHEALAAALSPMGIGVTKSLGFNNTYAIAVHPETAARRGLKKISDLRGQNLHFGFNHDFLALDDGLPGLVRHYGFELGETTAVDHRLAYDAVFARKIDGMEVYTTDAQLLDSKLVLLEDDRAFFPRYEGVILYRLDTAQREPKLLAALATLEGFVDESKMMKMNAKVELEKRPFAEVARETLGVSVRPTSSLGRFRLAERGLEHFELVMLSTFVAILIGLPLGIAAARKPKLASVVIGSSGVLQTIPTLALLCFLVPFTGIGLAPALIALVLYGILPIVVNTCTGLRAIDPRLIESADAMGMSSTERLRLVELPLSAAVISSGIQTSLIANVGTATLGALVGAGGFGQLIMQGLSTNDPASILAGAIPSAAFAVLCYGGMELVRRRVVPRGLRAP
ncbi:MAG: ABC transporter permease subunit [Deltaproteobacteria bacterium]|nr:ABC transporter permease subunit [Deltaproteobacteria bacterium]